MKIEAVRVQRIGGGQEGKCFENASLFCANNSQCDVVSGWFVNRWDKIGKSCLISAHYWSVDQRGDYFDSTPLHELNGGYVIDKEIGIYAQLNKIYLLSMVCTSIIFRENTMSGVELTQGGVELVYGNLDDLSTKSLFPQRKSS